MNWARSWGGIILLAALTAALAGDVRGQDLSLEISDIPDPVPAGGQLVYTVTVFNNVDFDLDGVQTLVSLAAGVTALETTGCFEDPDGVPVCGLGRIQAFGSKQFTILAGVPSGLTGTIEAVFDLTTIEPEVFLPEPTVVTTAVDSRVDLSLSLTVDPASDLIPIGENLVYTAEIRNNSLARAVGVLFQMGRPAPLRLVATTSPGFCHNTSTLINCQIPALEAGETAVVELEFEALSPGLVPVTAVALSRNGDLDSSDNQVSLLSRIETRADLAVEKIPDRRAVRAGGEVIYQITLTNLGPSPTGRAVWSDDLPAGVELLALEPAENCQSDPEPICEVAELAAGESASFTLSVRVGADVTGEITNSVQAAGEARDTIPGNNQATAVVEVRLVGDLNGDGVVDVLDAGVLIAELNDGDGQDPGDAAGGGFAGDPFFDVNEDGRIDEADVEALGRLILRKP